jgi:hypothetical protein
VILDGQGDLTVDGNEQHRVFFVVEGVTAELRGLTITGGIGGVANEGALTVVDCTISGNSRVGGIYNYNGVLTIERSTVSGNSAIDEGGGVRNLGPGTTTLLNSTVSGNRVTIEPPYTWPGDEGVWSVGGTLRLVQTTVVGTIYGEGATIVTAAAIVHGNCFEVGLDLVEWVSEGHNVYTEYAHCGFDPESDRMVRTNELRLGPLQDNGGPTETHALGEGSSAIDVVPQSECLDESGRRLAADQRGVRRPQGAACDAGAVEMSLRACEGVDCDDSNECTVDWCDPSNGGCVHADAEWVSGGMCTAECADPPCPRGDCVEGECVASCELGVTGPCPWHNNRHCCGDATSCSYYCPP